MKKKLRQPKPRGLMDGVFAQLENEEWERAQALREIEIIENALEIIEQEEQSRKQEKPNQKSGDTTMEQ